MNERDEKEIGREQDISNIHLKDSFEPNPCTKTSSNLSGLTNDMVDGIAAVIIIALVVSGAVFWLHNMP